MTKNVGPDEPAAGPWRVEPIEVVTDTFAAAHMGVEDGSDRPFVVAVDGRSGSGTTALAESLSAHVPHSVVVHTEDFAWHHAFFGWADVMREGVLEPLHRGEAVRYRPLARDERGGDGSVVVPEDCPAVFIEGVGAARSELMPWIDAVVWVQPDRGHRRPRPGERGGDRAHEDTHAWIAEEDRFLAEQRPWDRADLIVAGSPAPLRYDSATEVVVAPPFEA